MEPSPINAGSSVGVGAALGEGDATKLATGQVVDDASIRVDGEKHGLRFSLADNF